MSVWVANDLNERERSVFRSLCGERLLPLFLAKSVVSQGDWSSWTYSLRTRIIPD